MLCYSLYNNEVGRSLCNDMERSPWDIHWADKLRNNIYRLILFYIKDAHVHILYMCNNGCTHICTEKQRLKLLAQDVNLKITFLFYFTSYDFIWICFSKCRYMCDILIKHTGMYVMSCVNLVTLSFFPESPFLNDSRLGLVERDICRRCRRSKSVASILWKPSWSDIVIKTDKKVLVGSTLLS